VNKPKDVPQREWDYACERAKRAREYAAMFPIRPHDLRLQDPLWQWENEVRGRYNQRVGGA